MDVRGTTTCPIYRVMFVGDSLTTGLHATTRAQGFARVVMARLQDRMHGRRVEVLQVDKPGATLAQVAELTEPEPADLVVVELGTNDHRKTPLREFRSRYARLLRRLREASPEAALVCVGLWQPGWRSLAYDLVVQAQARRHRGTFVRISHLHDEPAHRGPAGAPTEVVGEVRDHFHPNDAGHAAIAAAVLAAI